MKNNNNSIKNSVNDITLSRTDAMDKCINLGIEFINCFDKIYQLPKSADVCCWISKMSRCYKEVKQIILKETNDYILDSDLYDWFFTAGAEPRDFMQKPTYHEGLLYNQFVRNVFNTENIESSIRMVMKDIE